MLQVRLLLARATLRARSLLFAMDAFVAATAQALAGHGSVPHRSQQRIMAAALVAIALLLASGMAGAFTAPATGDFGYDVYDIVVNQILNGPIGFIGGVALIVLGATQIMKNWMMTILCIIAGTVLIRAEALVVTLGATVR
jgi:hypothetical protein